MCPFTLSHTFDENRDININSSLKREADLTAFLLSTCRSGPGCQSSTCAQLQEDKEAVNLFQEAGTHCLCMEKSSGNVEKTR